MTEPRIPIQNLYYMLCYAWNHLEQGELVDISAIPTNELVDLLAVVLCQGIGHLARRGLEQGYETHEDELAGLRGRVDALQSGRRFLLQHGRALCRFDELTVNTLPNRILKSSLRLLDLNPSLHKSLRPRVRSLRQSLPGIDETGITLQSFRRVQLHANNRFYRFLLDVCKLIHTQTMVDPASGACRFRDFVRDEGKMARVFEDFLFNFLNHEARDCTVKREHIRWRARSDSDPGLAYLPRMQTDISLKRGSNRLIIDAKYYQNTFRSYYDTEKIHNANLYQLMSYLSNSERQGDEVLSGTLLYPQVERRVRERYWILGFEVGVYTVDLGQAWRGVRGELLELFDIT